MINQDKFTLELAKFLTRIEDPKVMSACLSNLLTPMELEEVAVRLQIFKKLLSGEPQRVIAEELEVGIATVTRGSREIKFGANGVSKVLSSNWQTRKSKR